jgi:hypothetical protein
MTIKTYTTQGCYNKPPIEFEVKITSRNIFPFLAFPRLKVQNHGHHNNDRSYDN